VVWSSESTYGKLGVNIWLNFRRGVNYSTTEEVCIIKADYTKLITLLQEYFMFNTVSSSFLRTMGRYVMLLFGYSLYYSLIATHTV